MPSCPVPESSRKSLIKIWLKYKYLCVFYLWSIKFTILIFFLFHLQIYDTQGRGNREEEPSRFSWTRPRESRVIAALHENLSRATSGCNQPLNCWCALINTWIVFFLILILVEKKRQYETHEYYRVKIIKIIVLLSLHFKV